MLSIGVVVVLTAVAGFYVRNARSRTNELRGAMSGATDTLVVVPASVDATVRRYSNAGWQLIDQSTGTDDAAGLTGGAQSTSNGGPSVTLTFRKR